MSYILVESQVRQQPEEETKKRTIEISAPDSNDLGEFGQFPLKGETENHIKVSWGYLEKKRGR